MDEQSANQHLEAAREAFARRAWREALDAFRHARQEGELGADDLYKLADSAWWLGDVDESLAASEEAFRLYLADERRPQASLTAVGIGYTMILRGEMAQGSAWISRAFRLLEGEPECVECGYLIYIELEAALEEQDYAGALEKAGELGALAEKFGDPNLAALSVVAEGRALIKQGEVQRGMELLDEAMLAALSDDLDPSWAGNIYCNLMIACHELADIRRAAEWTKAVKRWCESMSAAGPFMGICRVHRAQILQIQGEWDVAEREAELVYTSETHFDVNSIAEAYYQRGEVRRLRGDLDGADESYRQAHRLGRDPQPGLALLLLAKGQAAEALSSVQAALAALAGDRLGRVPLSTACVEIALAAGDEERAEAAVAELEETASNYSSPGLKVAALHAKGAFLLHRGESKEALQVLRAACSEWQSLSAPYEAARVRLLLARAYEELGDSETAAREREAATTIFGELGAFLKGQEPTAGKRLPAGLTEREAQVLALVTAGKSNREIGDELFISPRTVARHLENIFDKLAVSSRTAAAAYAIEHGLNDQPRST
jgi:ATP/maltotriose-dependent transcriptional regulator MalT